MRIMDILSGGSLPYDAATRRELDEILDRLGLVIGRRLALKGVSEADAFLRVAEALLELAPRLREIGDGGERDRWLIEFLDLGPYDPLVIAQEVEADRLNLDLERQARAIADRRLSEIDLERQIWMGRKLKSPARAKRRSPGKDSGPGGTRSPRPVEPS